MKNLFNEDYYERGQECGLSCYTNYHWMPELTIAMAEALVKQLRIERGQTILDFGCAKGFVVKALRGLGYDATGCDISEYAISCADDETKPHVFLHDPECGFILEKAVDWLLAKDVLEHVPEASLPGLLHEIRASAFRLFVAVPLGNGTVYTIPEMEKDVTHVIRRPLWWWTGAIEEAGFKIVRAGFTMPGIKENWTRRYPFGNGFIIAQ